MQTLSLKSSEAAFLRRVLERFRADADRRSRGATIGAASVLHGDAADLAAALLDKLQAARLQGSSAREAPALPYGRMVAPHYLVRDARAPFRVHDAEAGCDLPGEFTFCAHAVLAAESMNAARA